MLERYVSGKAEHRVLEYEAVHGWTLLSLKNLTTNQEEGLQHNLRLAITATKGKGGGFELKGEENLRNCQWGD